jgi:hypothetical protein
MYVRKLWWSRCRRLRHDEDMHAVDTGRTNAELQRQRRLPLPVFLRRRWLVYLLPHEV